MSTIDYLIARGKTLTGRKLRDALHAATGNIVGGRGIRVSTINGQSVVSITGHTPRAKGGGLVFPGFIDNVSLPNGFNVTYDIKSVDGVSLPVTSGFPCVPINRMFDTSDVDFHAASEGDLCQILALNTTPLQSPTAPVGGCMKFDGNCVFTNEEACDNTIGFFLGPGSPCAMFTIYENVKTRVCVPPPEVLAPPPIIRDVAGLLN